MKKITLIAIMTDIWCDDMMHGFDIFETWKRLIVDPHEIVIELKNDKPLKEIIEKTKRQLESTGKYKVQAIFHPYLEEGAWCNKSTIVVSNGKQYCKFADLLKLHNYVGALPKEYLNEA